MSRRFEGIRATLEDGGELTILTRILDDDSDRPDWRFCVRCNVLAAEKVAGDECGFCGGALTPTAGPKRLDSR